MRQKLQTIITIKIPRTINPVRDRGMHRRTQPQQPKIDRINMQPSAKAALGYVPITTLSTAQLLSLFDASKKYPKSAPRTVKSLPIELTKK